MLSLLDAEKKRLGEDYVTKYPTIVMVHVVNPYGMQNMRRVNEDNIDLNRNFLTPEQFKFVLERDPDFAGYLRTDFIFNPTQRISSLAIINDMYSACIAIYGSLIYGVGFLKR